MVSRCRKDAMLSIFFHELGHKHCHDMGIWRWYHTRYMRNGRYWYTKKLLNGIVKTGLKAEKWVDRWAEKTMKLYFPDIKYLVGYNEEGVKWYKENYIPWFKDKLNDD